MKKDLELYYFVPYEIIHNAGGYYKSDYGYTRYAAPEDYKSYSNYCIFDTKEQVADWFCTHPGCYSGIPIVYKATFVGKYQGVDDVIKITSLHNKASGYYTILDDTSYACYDEKESKRLDTSVWHRKRLSLWDRNKDNIGLRIIYETFKRKGAPIKHNISKPTVNREEEFAYRGSLDYACRENVNGKIVLDQPGRPANVKIKEVFLDIP